MFTQPLMYKAIKQHKSAHEMYVEKLVGSGVLTQVRGAGPGGTGCLEVRRNKKPHVRSPNLSPPPRVRSPESPPQCALPGLRSFSLLCLLMALPTPPRTAFAWPRPPLCCCCSCCSCCCALSCYCCRYCRSQADVDKMHTRITSILTSELEAASNYKPKKSDWLSSRWEGFMSPAQLSRIRTTGVKGGRSRRAGAEARGRWGLLEPRLLLAGACSSAVREGEGSSWRVCSRVGHAIITLPPHLVPCPCPLAGGCAQECGPRHHHPARQLHAT